MQKPLKIGHRGAKSYVAENTLESIQKALDLGVDGIEIDVHKCASGELVVFHDFTLDRMTNGSGDIGTHTLSELQMLKVNEQFKIPTLEEVLDIIDRQCLLNIELKGKDTALETTRIIDLYMTTRGWKTSDFIISSFQYHELEAVFKINRTLRLGVLTKASVSDAIAFARTINAYAVHPNCSLVTSTNVKLAHNEGYKVFVWTANEETTIARMKSYGVDGIISDKPDLL